MLIFPFNIIHLWSNCYGALSLHWPTCDWCHPLILIPSRPKVWVPTFKFLFLYFKSSFTRVKSLSPYSEIRTKSLSPYSKNSFSPSSSTYCKKCFLLSNSSLTFFVSVKITDYFLPKESCSFSSSTKTITLFSSYSKKMVVQPIELNPTFHLTQGIKHLILLQWYLYVSCNTRCFKSSVLQKHASNLVFYKSVEAYSDKLPCYPTKDLIEVHCDKFCQHIWSIRRYLYKTMLWPQNWVYLWRVRSLQYVHSILLGEH